MEESLGAVQDAARLVELRLLVSEADAPLREALDRLTGLAAAVLYTPVAAVSLVDRDRQIFFAASGLPEALESAGSVPLSHSFCRHVVDSGRPLVVEDARDHCLVRANPAVAEHGVIAYAGIPLVSRRGHVLGTLCVVDELPRLWIAREIDALADLAAAAMREVDRRLETRARSASPPLSARRAGRFWQLAERIGDVFWILDGESDRVYHVSPGYGKIWARTCGGAAVEAPDLAGPAERGELDFLLDGMERLARDHAVGAEHAVSEGDGAAPWFLARGFRDAPAGGGRMPNPALTPGARGVTNGARNGRSKPPSEQQECEGRPVFWICDERMADCLYVSAGCEAVWGWSPETLCGKPGALLDRVHPEDRASISEAVTTLQVEEDAVFEFRVLLPDGSARWLRSRGYRARGSGGRGGRITGVTEDVTNERRAALWGEDPEAVNPYPAQALVLLDADCTVTYVSPGLTSLLGHDADDLIGTKLLDLVHSDDVLAVEHRFRSLRQGAGRSVPARPRFQTRSGPWRVLEAEGMNLLGEPGVDGLVIRLRLVEANEERAATDRVPEERARWVLGQVPGPT
jgi:PAS domain S-box-containing protein